MGERMHRMSELERKSDPCPSPDPTPVSPRPTLQGAMNPPPQLDDPNYRFSSLLGTDRVRMGLRLEVGHAQGVKGRYKGGMKEGVMTANQRRKVSSAQSISIDHD